MAAGKLFNLIAFTALALLASSLGPTSVNAISTNHLQQHAHRHIAHDVAVRRKRAVASKRCKPRPSSAAATPSVTPNKAAAAVEPPKSSAPAKPAEPSKAAPAPPKAPEPPKNTPAPSTPPPSNGGGGGGVKTSGGKLGLAWANGGSWDLLQNFITPRVNAMYTWNPNCPANTGDVKCLPMMWGDKDTSKISEVLAQPATDKNNLVLFINEPNEKGQANMSPQHACDLYHQYLKPKEAMGYQFITPATSSNPNGLTWVQDFFKCCTDCHFTGMALHWYDTTLKKFQDYVNLWHDTFGMPIYITEYALQNFNGPDQPSPDQVITFHKQAAVWLEAQPFVVTYMPFGFMNDMSGVNEANRLMNGNTPTDLGKALLEGWF